MIDISLEDFKLSIDSKFWWHIRKKSIIPQESDLTKEEFLEQLYSKLSNGSYFVNSPRAFKIQGKSQMVARVIPLLTLEDYCVYYFCIKQLENDLALNRVRNTYGGFSLGGSIRQSEEEELEAMRGVAPSTSTRAYNMFGWLESWTDFQDKAWQHAINTDASSFLFFDIANFYDTIDLNKLEGKVRHAAPKDKTTIVNLLFSFLRNWNRKVYGYNHQSKGIPQDEVGDCSRILANFFLQDYDQKIFEYCEAENITYFRYADDQIFMSDSDNKNLQALYQSSILLHREGININASKIKMQNEHQFTRYWAFEILNDLKDKDDNTKVEAAVRRFFNWCDDREGRDSFRWWSVQARIMTCNIQQLPLELKHRILTECYKADYLLDASSFNFHRVYELTPSDERRAFTNSLINLVDVNRFNAYLYELLDFNRKNSVFSEDQIEYINEKIEASAL